MPEPTPPDHGPSTPFDLDVDRLVDTTLPSTAAGPLDAATVEVLDAAARRSFAACAGTPGAVVGVRSPAGTWTAAYGSADPEAGTAMTTEAHLRIGSVTKTAVATLVLQLVEQGRLTLDRPIADFVDGVPNGDRITLDLLARMRSGLADYLANPAVVGRVVADPTAAFTPSELVEAAAALTPAFEPDARMEYSNTNYTLLGLVVERVTGRALGEVLEERILGPLSLSGTSWPGESTTLPDPHARGFTASVPPATPATPVETTGWNPSWAGAAGAMISTVDDLLVYGRAVVTGQRLLEGPAQAQRLRSFRPAPALAPGVSYGIGLMSIGRWIGHSGDIPGYRAAMYVEASSDTTLVVLTNSDIVAGRCTGRLATVAIASDAPCKPPTARIFDDVATALGIPTETPVAA